MALNNQVVVQVLTMGEWLITTSKMMIKLEIEIGISSKISFRFNKEANRQIRYPKHKFNPQNKQW